jgi:hypothetical protein
MHTLKFLTLSMLTLAVGLAADHPITVSGGSPLRIEHDSWKHKDDHTLATSIHGNTVTRVEVTSASGTLPPIVFNGEMLELHLTYGAIHLTVMTDAQGHDPVVKVDSKTSLKKHFRKKDAAAFESMENAASVQELTLQKAGTAQDLGSVSGHTVIVIHYE